MLVFNLISQIYDKTFRTTKFFFEFVSGLTKKYLFGYRAVGKNKSSIGKRSSAFYSYKTEFALLPENALSFKPQGFERKTDLIPFTQK